MSCNSNQVNLNYFDFSQKSVRCHTVKSSLVSLTKRPDCRGSQ